MEQTVRSSKGSQGFSIIEILIALAILVMVMLALFEAATLYTKQNMSNILRDEAVRVTQDTLYNLRTQDYSAVTSSGTISASNDCTAPAVTVTKMLRSQQNHWAFDVCWVVLEDGTHTRKSVTVVTTYTFLSQMSSVQASLVVIPQ